MNPALYGPLGSVGVAVIAGLLLVWGNKINKRVSKEDITEQIGGIWKEASDRLDSDRKIAKDELAECKTTVRLANEQMKRRDLATYDFLEKQADHEATLYRLIDMLERVAVVGMPAEQAAVFRADQVIARQQRDDVHAAGRALRESMYAA